VCDRRCIGIKEIRLYILKFRLDTDPCLLSFAKSNLTKYMGNWNVFGLGNQPFRLQVSSPRYDTSREDKRTCLGNKRYKRTKRRVEDLLMCEPFRSGSRANPYRAGTVDCNVAEWIYPSSFRTPFVFGASLFYSLQSPSRSGKGF
jgi:hypothetical protein